MSTLTYGIALEIISSEVHSSRFEDFSNSIVSAIEGGAVIVRTSASWDLGRDGRSVSRSGAIFCCASLKDSVDQKASGDISRLIQFVQPPARLYFCSSQKLSEHGVNAIESYLRGILSDEFNITVLGAIQLAELMIRFPGVGLQYFSAEIEDCLHALREDAGEDRDIPGLRLALLAATHDDSASIRAEVYSSGILNVMADNKPRSLGEICRDFAGVLKLNRNIPEEAISLPLKQMMSEGSVVQDSERYQITSQGLKRHTEQESIAARELLSGRQLIRESIESSLGQSLADEHYRVIWNTLEDKVVSYFYSRGEYMVNEVSKLTGVDLGQPASTDNSVMPGFNYIEDLASAVAASSSLASQREELKTAVRDLFSDREGPAAEWLIRVCCSYIAACSVGLESTCGNALGRLLSKMALVLDTDVLLSLLCEGEPDHQSANAIMKRWVKLGGKILFAEPVLEETAYHASIAENDYRDVSKWLPGTSEERLRLIENAFVRGFAELVAINKAKPNHWHSYINQYRGSSPKDVNKIEEYLSSEYGVQGLPPPTIEEKNIEQQVKNHLSIYANSHFSGVQLRNALDKARRDAFLYASMVGYLKNIRKADSGATCLLVSSAKRLSDVETKFAQAGERHIVVPISMVLYLLSLVPEVSLGIGAMKAFIFDERRIRFSSDLERMLLRVLRESDQVSLPWAKRGTLMRQVREKLMEDARRAGEPARSEGDIVRLESRALTAENRLRTVELLSQSLDAVAADRRIETEQASLKKRVAELEAENARLRKNKQGR